MSTKIYTKTGDKGQTGLIGNVRVSKGDSRLDVYGSFDELNAALGLCVSQWPPGVAEDSRLTVLRTQHQLFNLGSRLACSDKITRESLPHIDDEDIVRMEKEIDELTGKLLPLKSFILPGGTQLAALLHFARAVCRRAERNLVAFYDGHLAERDEKSLRYLNRLSDYLFVVARAANSAAGIEDIEWRKG